MSSHTHNGPRPSASTRAAAQACLARMAARRSGAAHQARESPAAMARGLARTLLAEAGDASHLSLVKGPGADDVPDAGLAAAWPLRFGGAEPGHEKPLLYFLRASAASALSAACWETQDRGIILNLAETTPSRWTKGVMPDVPGSAASAYSERPVPRQRSTKQAAARTISAARIASVMRGSRTRPGSAGERRSVAWCSIAWGAGFRKA